MFQKPLIVCVGFLSCKPRYLGKYADVLRKININLAPLHSHQKVEANADVIQYVQPKDAYFLPKAAQESTQILAKEIEQALAKPVPIVSSTVETAAASSSQVPTVLPPRKIMFLLQSNGGAYTYTNLQDFLRKNNPQLYKQLNAQTVGIIWDSAPSYPAPYMSSVAACVCLASQATLPVLSGLFTAGFSLFNSISSIKKMNTSAIQELKYGVPYHIPQLYLLAQVDPFIPPSATAEYLQDRRDVQDEFFNKYIKSNDDDSISNVSDHNDGKNGQEMNVKANDDAVNVNKNKPSFLQKLLTMAGSTKNNEPYDDRTFYDHDTVVARQASFFKDFIQQQHLPSSPGVKGGSNDDDVSIDFTKIPNVDYLFDGSKRQKESLEQDPSLAPFFEQTAVLDKQNNQFVYTFVPGAHVQQLRVYPEEYRQEVTAFTKYAFRG